VVCVHNASYSKVLLPGLHGYGRGFAQLHLPQENVFTLHLLLVSVHGVEAMRRARSLCSLSPRVPIPAAPALGAGRGPLCPRTVLRTPGTSRTHQLESGPALSLFDHLFLLFGFCFRQYKKDYRLESASDPVSCWSIDVTP